MGAFSGWRAAVKLHTYWICAAPSLLFLYISGGRAERINVLDFLPIEAGSFYVMDRGYPGLQAFVRHAPSGGFSLHAPGQPWMRGCLFRRRRSNRGVICDQRSCLTAVTSKKYLSK